ncbi:MAG: hypothetical protein ACT4QF_20565 [Sporichthyaceae bacterium]
MANRSGPLAVLALAVSLLTACGSSEQGQATAADLQPRPTATVYVTVAPETPKASPTPKQIRPRGAVIVTGGPQETPGGSFYGRQGSNGNCSSYRVGVTNNSNAEVVAITFTASDAGYWSLDAWEPTQTKPSTVEVSIPAHSGQDVLYRLCGTNKIDKAWRLHAYLGDAQKFRWATGHTGTATYSP